MAVMRGFSAFCRKIILRIPEKRRHGLLYIVMKFKPIVFFCALFECVKCAKLKQRFPIRFSMLTKIYRLKQKKTAFSPCCLTFLLR